MLKGVHNVTYLIVSAGNAIAKSGGSHYLAWLGLQINKGHAIKELVFCHSSDVFAYKPDKQFGPTEVWIVRME